MVASVTPSLQKPCFWPWRSRAIYEESTCSIQPQNQSWSACWGHHFWMISSRLRFWLFRSVLVAAFLNQTKYQNSVSAAQPDFGPCVGKMATVLVLIWVGTVYFDLSCSDLGAETKTKKKIKPFFFGIVFFFFPFFFRKKGKRKKSNKSHKELLRKFVLQSTCLLTIPKRVSRIVCSDFFILGFFLEKKKENDILVRSNFFWMLTCFLETLRFLEAGKKALLFFSLKFTNKKGNMSCKFFPKRENKKRILLVFFLLFREKQFSNWYENCSHGVRAKKGKTWNNHKITPKRESNLWRKKKKDKRIRGEKKKKRNLFFFLMFFFP